MKKFPIVLMLLLIPCSNVFGEDEADRNPLSEPDWKGTPYPHKFTAGAMFGLGIMDNQAGFGIPISVSYKILHEGFIPDINDQVHFEVQMGPLIRSSQTDLTYSGHLRWDFHKTYEWSLYALGGIAGMFTHGARIYPRMAGGIQWHLFERASFRCEFSHEFIGLGVQVPFDVSRSTAPSTKASSVKGKKDGGG